MIEVRGKREVGEEGIEEDIMEVVGEVVGGGRDIEVSSFGFLISLVFGAKEWNLVGGEWMELEITGRFMELNDEALTLSFKWSLEC